MEYGNHVRHDLLRPPQLSSLSQDDLVTLPACFSRLCHFISAICRKLWTKVSLINLFPAAVNRFLARLFSFRSFLVRSRTCRWLSRLSLECVRLVLFLVQLCNPSPPN